MISGVLIGAVASQSVTPGPGPGPTIPTVPEFTSVYMTSDDTGLTSGAVFSWDATHVNTLGAWDIANPTRLTVPAGTSLVKLYAHVAFGLDNSPGSIQVRFNYNGGAYAGAQPRNILSRSTVGVSNNERYLVSGVLPVTPGVYFELQAFWDVAGLEQITADSGKFYCLMEKIA